MYSVRRKDIGLYYCLLWSSVYVLKLELVDFYDRIVSAEEVLASKDWGHGRLKSLRSEKILLSLLKNLYETVKLNSYRHFLEVLGSYEV